MSQHDLHRIGVSDESQDKIEGVSAQFIKEGILEARAKSWLAFHAVRNSLQEGLTELEGRNLALKTFEELGVKKHWHRPNLRFSSGTRLTFNDSLQPEYRLQQGDMVFIDLGPVWSGHSSGLEYEGDVGDTFIFGASSQNASESQRCIDAARALFLEAQEKWNSKSLSGKDIYEYLHTRSQELGYRLLNDVSGHRVSDFPHHKYSKKKIIEVDTVLNPYLWVLEIQIVHPTLPIGAFFEDLLF